MFKQPHRCAGSGFGAVQGAGQVWLGTTFGTVQGWSDTQVVAQIAAGSASGKVQILQNNVWSNAVPFTMDTLSLTSISPASGASVTAVAFTGTGFGASQGSGVVWLGSVAGQVVSWTDTRVVATVAFNALTGIARIQQNSVWSNSLGFTVPVSGGGTASNTVMPAMLNMAVGDTHTIQALSSAGLPATGLTWTSSDPTVVSLSADYPPILSALAAGHVTITAGTASADVTVSAGALALGTVIWSNPGDGSGVKSIVPAVPSATGVADVFAFQNDSTVQAITSDGTTAWTANLGSPYGYAIPDFQGGLVALEPNNDGSSSIIKFDGITGQPYPAYTSGPPATLMGLPVVHTDGTIFAMESSPSGEGAVNVIGIDPTTGTQKFSVQVVGPEIDGYAPGGPYGIMIAGDGYAYLPYMDQDFLGPVGTVTWVSHFMLLRVDSSGNYDRIHVQDWPSLADFQEEGWERSFNMITNADQGIVLTWRLNNPIGIYDGMAVTTGTSASVVAAPSVPGQVTNLVPVLQAQDGSFVGTAGTGDPENPQNNMVAFDASGNVRWVVQDEQPQIATADGGVIGQSGITYDQSGNATGQVSLFTQSWTLNAYQDGPVTRFVANLLNFGVGFWPFQKGSTSHTGTSQMQIDSVTNDKVKGILTPALWAKFKASNCAVVFANPQGIAGGIAYYSLATAQLKQNITNFYDVSNPWVQDLTLSQVTQGTGQVQSNQSLLSYLGTDNAFTSPNFGYNNQSAIVFKAGILAQTQPEFTVMHELLLHAYTAWSDRAIFGNAFLAQKGLWRQTGSTATTNITLWMSTDCTCTPGNPATPNCQANTAKW